MLMPWHLFPLNTLIWCYKELSISLFTILMGIELNRKKIRLKDKRELNVSIQASSMCF